MPGKQKASVLLSKALDDQKLVLHMIAGGIGTDEQVGFWCQQAVEKSIKAVLEQRNVSYLFTHDLAELIDTLIDQLIAYPTEMNTAVDLTRFAGGLGYHDLPTDATGDDTFDRDAAVRAVRSATQWASAIVNVPEGT